MTAITIPPHGAPARRPASADHAETLEKVLADAQQLLIYAVQNGTVVDPAIAKLIIAANHSGHGSQSCEDIGELMSAIAALAVQVRPVTADSLASCRTVARRQIRIYTWLAAVLAFFIIPVSAVSFVATGDSNVISTDLRTANDQALTLYPKVDILPAVTKVTQRQTIPNPELSNLHAFAETIRAIKDRSVTLNGFLFFGKVHQQWPADDNIEVHSNALQDLRPELDRLTVIYRTVHRNAAEIQDEIAMWYGAFATFVLPIFYALLGACGYLLRLFSRELTSSVFSDRYDISSRFFIALIGGTIVGLFNNFTVPGASLSPLALAFLVGYGADFFFSFLDGLLASVKEGRAAQYTGGTTNQRLTQ